MRRGSCCGTSPSCSRTSRSSVHLSSLHCPTVLNHHSCTWHGLPAQLHPPPHPPSHPLLPPASSPRKPACSAPPWGCSKSRTPPRPPLPSSRPAGAPQSRRAGRAAGSAAPARVRRGRGGGGIHPSFTLRSGSSRHTPLPLAAPLACLPASTVPNQPFCTAVAPARCTVRRHAAAGAAQHQPGCMQPPRPSTPCAPRAPSPPPRSAPDRAQHMVSAGSRASDFGKGTAGDARPACRQADCCSSSSRGCSRQEGGRARRVAGTPACLAACIQRAPSAHSALAWLLA